MLIQQINRNDPEAIFLSCIAEGVLVIGDVVQWSDTDSTAYPAGVSVEDSVADDMRVAGVVVGNGAAVAGDSVQVQVFGYCDNITTDGSVASTDKVLTAGAAVAVGQTESEVNGDITTASYASLANIFAWNIKTDSSTKGEGFIKLLGI